MFEPDKFFDAVQIARLKELFDRWRMFRDTREPFLDEDQAELETLTMTELKASGLRAKAFFEVLEQ